MGFCPGSGLIIIIMKKRLEKTAELVDDGRGAIDVGTDHCRLPVYLACHGYSGNLYASDIRSGPLESAARTLRHAGLEDRIKLILCDGLDLCPKDEIDTIVIAGMGGDTICGILDRAEWCLDGSYTLVLQPMTKAEVLRFWLVNNGFSLTRELYVREGGNIYQIIKASYGSNMCLSDAELYTGAWENIKDDELAGEVISALAERFSKDIDGLRRAASTEPGKLDVYGRILTDLIKMKGRLE